MLKIIQMKHFDLNFVFLLLSLLIGGDLLRCWALVNADNAQQLKHDQHRFNHNFGTNSPSLQMTNFSDHSTINANRKQYQNNEYDDDDSESEGKSISKGFAGKKSNVQSSRLHSSMMKTNPIKYYRNYRFTMNSPQSSVVNCSHYSNSCHDCLHHSRSDCFFLFCEHRNFCIDLKSPLSNIFDNAKLFTDANSRCRLIDKCPAVKRQSYLMDHNGGKLMNSVNSANSRSVSSIGSTANNTTAIASKSTSNPSASNANTGRLYRNLPYHTINSNRMIKTKSISKSNTNNNEQTNRIFMPYGLKSNNDKNNNNNDNKREFFHHFFTVNHLNEHHGNGGGESWKRTRYVGDNIGNDRLVVTSKRISSSFGANHHEMIQSRKQTKPQPYHGLVYHISFGTVLALMICSSLVLSVVIMVAYKKIMKIYTTRNSYGSLHDDS